MGYHPLQFHVLGFVLVEPEVGRRGRWIVDPGTNGSSPVLVIEFFLPCFHFVGLGERPLIVAAELYITRQNRWSCGHCRTAVVGATNRVISHLVFLALTVALFLGGILSTYFISSYLPFCSGEIFLIGLVGNYIENSPLGVMASRFR